MGQTKAATADGLAIFLRTYGPGTELAPRTFYYSCKSKVQSTAGVFADDAVSAVESCLVRLVGRVVTAGKVTVKDGGAAGVIKAVLYLDGSFDFQLDLHIATSLYLDYDGTVANGDINCFYLEDA